MILCDSRTRLLDCTWGMPFRIRAPPTKLHAPCNQGTAYSQRSQREHLARQSTERHPAPPETMPQTRGDRDAVALLRATMQLVIEEIRLLKARIGQSERELGDLARQSPPCKALLTIPDIGLLSVTEMLAATSGSPLQERAWRLPLRVV